MQKSSSYYSPLKDKTIWSGRHDALDNDYLYQTIQWLDLDNAVGVDKHDAGYVLLGFECDEGVCRNQGNAGAKEGPMAFRQVAGKLSIHHPFKLYDAGNVICLDHHLEAAQDELKKRVSTILSLGQKPIVIGGGHETAWGHFQGVATHYQDDIAILNFDAHFDLRPLINNQLGSSGTPFRQINEDLKSRNKPFYYYCAGIQPYANTKRLFDYAHENKVTYLLAEQIQANPYDLSWIEHIISNHQRIYVSVCLDVFSAALAPGVSAPQALGIDPTFVIEALKLLRQSQHVVSLDIVELSPKYDIQQNTAKLAAALFMTYCMPK
ncbi:MAG: formimidoylglutamase [Legionellaceae bacterium]|nr:formimidoylglutamase [Legionellaceae bacterium]